MLEVAGPDDKFVAGSFFASALLVLVCSRCILGWVPFSAHGNQSTAWPEVLE